RASRFATDWLLQELRAKPESILCLATGATPMRTYELIAGRAAVEKSLVAQCQIVQLDEWGGLPNEDPTTCEQHLRRTLITPLGLADGSIGFQIQPPDAQAECDRVAKWLADNGPIDLCVLGLGRNGHLGFNEPAAFLQPHAHVAQLSEETLSHAMIKS